MFGLLYILMVSPSRLELLLQGCPTALGQQKIPSCRIPIAVCRFDSPSPQLHKDPVNAFAGAFPKLHKTEPLGFRWQL